MKKSGQSTSVPGLLSSDSFCRSFNKPGKAPKNVTTKKVASSRRHEIDSYSMSGMIRPKKSVLVASLFAGLLATHAEEFSSTKAQCTVAPETLALARDFGNNNSARIQAISSLRPQAETGEHCALEPLLQIMRDHNEDLAPEQGATSSFNFEVRNAAIGALANIQNDEVRTELTQFFASPVEPDPLRFSALKGLIVELEAGSETFLAIRSVANNPSHSDVTRIRAIAALSKICDVGTMNMLSIHTRGAGESQEIISAIREAIAQCHH